MIYLRRLQESDLQERVLWMNDASVYPSMGYTPPISIETTINWFQSNLNNNSRLDCVFVCDDGSLASMAGLTSINYESRKAELYLFVNPKRHRQGLGKMSAYLLCKYAFDVLHLNKVYLYTNSSNYGARHVYEDVGFRLEGTHRQERFLGNKYEDRLYYGLLVDEFDFTKLPLSIIGDNSHI